MKMLAKGCLLLWILLMVAGCGAKKLSVEEYSQMSPQDRIAYLEQQVAKKTKDLQLKQQLYQEYLNIGNNDRALAILGDIVANDPYNVDLQFQYGELQYKNGNTRAAFQAFLNVMESSSADLYLSKVQQYVGGKYIVQQITNSKADEAFPRFSPDGKKIVYQKWVDNNWDIYQMELETSTETVLVGTEANEELPEFSPDGRYLLYTSTEMDLRPVDNRLKSREILKKDLVENYVMRLTRSNADDWLPKYNTDGSKIVFVSDRTDLRKVSYISKQSDVFIMDSDGNFQLPLTESQANDGGAVFSADSKNIYFHSNRNGNYDVMVMHNNGSKKMTVIDSEGNDVNPDCSKDGKWLVFVSDRNGNYEIYLASSTGENQQQITFNVGEDNNPAFSPDNNSVVFHSNRNGNYDIFMITLSVSNEEEATVAGIVAKLQSLLQ
jgi:Tol biopolymer transport system component